MNSGTTRIPPRPEESGDFDRVLGQIVDRSMATTHADSCLILLEGPGARARVVASAGIDAERASRFAAPLDERINTPLRDLLAHEPDDVFVGVPIIDEAGIQGILVAHWKASAAPEGHEGRLAILADAAGLAMERAARSERLYLLERAARLQVEKELNERDEALALVVHDLKNPLGVIAISAQTLLRAESLDDERNARTRLEAIHRAASQMTRLVTDILDAASAEGQRWTMSPESLSAAALVHEAASSIAPLAQKRGVTIEQEVPVPLWVCGDRQRLLQVFENLLGNAIKFSADGGTVRVRAEAYETSVGFFVQDEGPGISELDLPHVFERYWRAQGSGQAGSGLGLYIARGIVEAHGGRIWAESEVGAGARIIFTVPRQS